MVKARRVSSITISDLQMVSKLILKLWCAGRAQGDGMGRLGGRRVQDGEHVYI